MIFFPPTGKQTEENLFIDQKVTEDKAIFTLSLKGFTPVFPTSNKCWAKAFKLFESSHIAGSGSCKE